MADARSVGNCSPITSTAFQLGLYAGIDSSGHSPILVKHSCAVKEQITKWMGDPRGVSENSREPISEIVASNLDVLMKQAQLSQPALALKAGVSQKTISNYLNPQQRVVSASGKVPGPKLEELNKIADALDVPLWRIVKKWDPRELRFYERMEQLWAEMTESERGR